MEPGQYVRALAVAAEQADLSLSLECDELAEPLLSDAAELRGEFAEEEVAWIAREGGSCRLRLKAWETSKPTHYKLELSGPLRPNRSDRLRAEAIGSSIWAEKPTDSLTTTEDWQRRLSLIRRGPQLWEQLQDASRQAHATFYVARVLAALARSDEATRYYTRAAELYRQQGQDEGEAASRNNLGNLLRQKRRAEEALVEYDQALEFYSRSPIPRHRLNEAMALSNRGNTKIDLARLGEAIEDLKQASRLFQEVGDKKGRATTLTILGVAYEARDDKQNAREAYEEAVHLAEETGDPAVRAHALHGMGHYYLTAGIFAKASEYFERSVALQDDRPTFDQARSLNNLGRSRFLIGDHDGARKAYQQGLAILSTHPDRETRIHLLNNFAVLELETGATEVALKLVRQALELAQDDEPMLACLEIEGSILRRRKDLPAARRSLERALRLGEELGTHIRRSGILLQLVYLEMDSGAPEKARQRAEQALKLVESSRSQLLGENERSAHLASRRIYYDAYITSLLALGRSEEALEVSERARARSLLETLGTRRFDLQEEAQPALIEARRRLLSSVQDANFQVTQMRESRAARAEVRRAEEVLSRRWEDLVIVEERMREASPRYAALTRPEPLAAEEIRRHVVEGDALLLEYWLGEEKSVLWAVTSQKVETHEIPESRATLERQARCFSEALMDPRTRSGRPAECSEAERRRSGMWLSEKLLGPVAGILGDRTLLVVADGALQYIPFSALPDPAAPKSYLLARHAVVNLPSASVLAALREKPRTAGPPSAIVFADPVFRGDDPRLSLPQGARPRVVESPSRDAVSPWGRLSATRKEADEICRILPSGRCKVVRDFAASTDTVKGSDLSPYRMVHFATHGDVNGDIPSLSRLVLSAVDEEGRARPGFLYLYDIYNLRLDADVVVLSACNTALGKEMRGEGLIGLTRGFMYAGARSVVASLWSVDSAATRELMIEFYRFLARDGLSPAQALRAAQLEMAKSEKSAPFYWAGFTLQGEWR